MRYLIAFALAVLQRAFRRFLVHAPANEFEAMLFGAVRNMAYNFGKVVA